MDVLNELLQNGHFVWQCYDAFYARKKRATQEYFNEYVTNLVKEKVKEGANNPWTNWFYNDNIATITYVEAEE